MLVFCAFVGMFFVLSPSNTSLLEIQNMSSEFPGVYLQIPVKQQHIFVDFERNLNERKTQQIDVLKQIKQIEITIKNRKKK